MILIFLIILSSISCLFIGIYRSYALQQNILDHPNQRSSHAVPTPLGGGVVFWPLWSVALLVIYFKGLISAAYLLMLLPPTFLIGLIGFLDDKYQVPACYRFIVQLGAVAYVLYMLGSFAAIDFGVIVIHWYWFGYIFTALALLWSINLYNFMDGMDGSAATEALFVFGVGGFFIWCASGTGLAIVIWSIAAIAAGFLLWNKPPAKIFMGDSGSTLLGFLVALFAIIGEKKYHVPALLWVILYGVFWFDATVTLIRRFINGEKVYQGHRLHAFQRLHLYGWSHGKILVGIILVNTVLAGFSVVAFNFTWYMPLMLVSVIIMLTIIYVLIEKLRPMYLCTKPQQVE